MPIKPFPRLALLCLQKRTYPCFVSVFYFLIVRRYLLHHLGDHSHCRIWRKRGTTQGVEFLKVLKRTLQEQMGWERKRGCQKCSCDLAVFITLLRKGRWSASEPHWIIALCFFANGPYGDHFIKVTFCICITSHHVAALLEQLFQIKWIRGPELHSSPESSVIQPQPGFLKSWQKPKTPFTSP